MTKVLALILPLYILYFAYMFCFAFLHRFHQEPPGTTVVQVWHAKKLQESAFHPDSGELQNVIGRMSFQVPGGMILTAGMLQFYR